MQDKLQELKQKIETYQAKSVLAPELKAFATLILSVVKTAKENFDSISKENLATIQESIAYIEAFHDKHTKLLDSKSNAMVGQFDAKYDLLKGMLEDIKKIKATPGKNGKDADETLIIESVLEQIKLPEYEVFSLEEKGEQIVEQINALPLEDEYKIDASHIKNLPKAEVKANGGGWRNLYQMHDVELSSPTDNQVLTYDSATNTWKNETPTGGGTIDGSGTANELTYWVDTDTVGALAVATYPSLTEVSYVKGVTSAIQTQLNAKQASDAQLTSLAGLSYAGNALKVIRVNAGETDFELVALAGGGDALVANPLSQFAATTSLQLKGVMSDETGSGALVFSDTPTLVTPVLGVATATSINKVAITAPATSATLTIADGATLTVNGSATITNGTHSGTNTGDQDISGKANTSGALTQFVGNGNRKVWYSDGSGDVQELALGADGTFLKSNGAALAPSFATPTGSGDVSKVGTPVNNQIGVWTGDGTIEGDVDLTFDTATNTLGVGLIGLNGIVQVHSVKSDASDGLLIEANNGTDVGLLGVGNTANATWYGTHNFESGLIQIGKNTTTLGKIKLFGSTSGDVTIQPNAVAGTGIVLTAPATTGTLALTSQLTSGTVTSVGFTGGIISVATATTTPAFTVAGTSGGIPYFSSASTWATSAALAANSLVIGGGAGVAPSTITTGANVLTALGVAVGSAGAFVTFNGALGTPSSGVATNLTGTASGLTAGNVTTNANLTGMVTSVGNATSLGSFTKAQLNTAISDGDAVYLDSIDTITGVKTMTGLNVILVSSSGLTVRNPANTFKYTITGAAIAADRILNLPLITATDTLASLGLAQTWTATQTFVAPALGTPASGVVTNLTGTASININGTVGATTPTTATFTTATINTSLLPDADDGAVLGSSGTAFSDLFLASGGVINWNAGNATLTHSASLLTSNVDVAVPDEVYGAGWNGSLEVPTKNAIYDKIETISGGSGNMYINQTPDNGTYGLISGTVNGSNAVFTVSQGSYTSGTLQVYLNGLLQLQGASDDWQETVPGSGTFTFNTAPTTGDIITAVYGSSTVVSTTGITRGKILAILSANGY